MLKFALFAILAYLLIRAVLNLMRAMSHSAGPPGGSPPNGRRRSPRFRQRERRSGGEQRREERRGREQGTRATRLREDDENVEDARWEDL